jgi:hypothetical protein
MDEKEMLNARMDALVEFEKRGTTGEEDTAFESGFQAACACMMGKAEPVYEASSVENHWMEIQAHEVDGYAEKGFKVRTLYTAPPMQNPEREIVLPELPKPDITEGGNYWDRDSVESAQLAAVLQDRESRK